VGVVDLMMIWGKEMLELTQVEDPLPTKLFK
jgi:hypothetical protein